MMQKNVALMSGRELIEVMTECASQEDVLAIRLGMGLTQGAFAEALGVNEFTVWRWENGKCPVTSEMAKKMYDLAEDRNECLAKVRKTIRENNKKS
jgi:DNA-binding transcriptional regulator YiaG